MMNSNRFLNIFILNNKLKHFCKCSQIADQRFDPSLHILKCNFSLKCKQHLNKKMLTQISSLRNFSQYNVENKNEKNLMRFSDFEEIENKNKKTFMEMIYLYESNFITRKAHVEFIRNALKHMKEFGVQDDLEVYKKLLDLMPKGVMVSKNIIQIETMKYPNHQFLAADLLDQMSINGVAPDVEVGNILARIFGRMSHPWRKFSRMLYWFTKFKNKSPWPLPEKVSSDPFFLGKLAIERITSVDIQTEISEFQTEEVPESIDKTWIISAQSPKQRELLKMHDQNVPIVVEEGDIVWIKNHMVRYFILKADTEPMPYKLPDEGHDLTQMSMMFFNPNFTEKKEPCVHTQDNEIIFAVCVTGTSSKDSLLSWIRFLQKNQNPIIGDLPVLFKFKSKDKVPAIFGEVPSDKTHI